MIVIRVVTGNVVEMESEPDKKGKGGNTTHQEYEIKVGYPC